MNHQATRAALLGVSAVIAIAYLAFNSLPSQAELASQQVLLDQQGQLVSHAKAVPMQVAQVRQLMATTEQFCDGWRSRLATEDQLPGHFTSIVKLAETHGLQVMDFDPGHYTKLAGIIRAPLNLTVETSFPKLVEFLAATERMEPLTWASQATITAKEEGKDTLACKVTFVVFAKNSEFSNDVKHAPHPIP